MQRRHPLAGYHSPRGGWRGAEARSFAPNGRHHMRRGGWQDGMNTTFAARLNKLFEAVYPPGRGPHTSHEVVKELRGEGIRISAPYLSQLRTGQRTNPSAEIMESIAQFFRISVDYFTDDRYFQKVDKELTWLLHMRNENVRLVTSRRSDSPRCPCPNGSATPTPCGARSPPQHTRRSGRPLRTGRRQSAVMNGQASSDRRRNPVVDQIFSPTTSPPVSAPPHSSNVYAFAT